MGKQESHTVSCTFIFRATIRQMVCLPFIWQEMIKELRLFQDSLGCVTVVPLKKAVSLWIEGAEAGLVT